MKTKRYHFDEETLRRGHVWNVWEGKNVGVTSRDDGTYQCHQCGCSWQAETIWSWWPVTLGLARSWGLGRHGIETGSDGIERKVCAQVWSIGPLRVVLGNVRRGP